MLIASAAHAMTLLLTQQYLIINFGVHIEN